MVRGQPRPARPAGLYPLPLDAWVRPGHGGRAHRSRAEMHDRLTALVSRTRAAA